MAMLRSMMQSVDAGIEDAIDAHGFSFSALSADGEGAVLHFATPNEWRLTLNLPPDGRSRVSLRRGGAEAPTVSLTLTVGEDGACRSLPAALGIAMELFTSIDQA
jgi:hypothetical protein